MMRKYFSVGYARHFCGISIMVSLMSSVPRTVWRYWLLCAPTPNLYSLAWCGKTDTQTSFLESKGREVREESSLVSWEGQPCYEAIKLMSPEILFTLQVPSVSFLIGPRHPVILQRQFPHVQQPRATVTDMLIFALGAKPLLSSLFLVPRTLSTHLPTRGPDNCPPRATQRSFILLTGTLCLPDLRPSPLALCSARLSQAWAGELKTTAHAQQTHPGALSQHPAMLNPQQGNP